uniref:Uncharacterized protein n=1 Tax=Ditylenchus dipsaci TaxID=166011 RepID=A0A915E653_9BILA
MLILILWKHDEQRKNLQSQPKECAAERSLSRSSSVPKRDTASFQVDFISDVIAKLKKDREMLLNRLCFGRRLQKSRSPKTGLYQSFTGNHVRRLLTGDGLKKIVDIVRCNEKCGALEELLTLLVQIQSMAKSTFLSNEQVILLGKLTHGFFLCLREHFLDASVTPKCHLLCSHVEEFLNYKEIQILKGCAGEINNYTTNERL